MAVLRIPRLYDMYRKRLDRVIKEERMKSLGLSTQNDSLMANTIELTSGMSEIETYESRFASQHERKTTAFNSTLFDADQQV